VSKPEPKAFGIPPQEAIKLIKAKGFGKFSSIDWRDVWAETHAAAFTVARSAGYDVVGDIYKAVLEAQEGKLTFKDFQAQLQPILQAKGWWGRKDGVQLGSPRRLEIIYRTNLRQAEAAGRWTQIQALKEKRPYLRYVCINDDKAREEHKAWHGLVLPVDHPFWDEHYPPNGWNCRCYVMQLTEEQAKRFGYTPSAGDNIPFDTTEPWFNERTNQEIMIPRGVDPAFAHNAGKVAIEVHAAQALGYTLEKLPAEVAAQAMAASGEFVARALAPQLKAMLDYVERGKSWNQHVIVGGLREEVLVWLKEKESIIPESGAIGLSDKKLWRLIRDLKKKAMIDMSRADILNLPHGLARPKKILWDGQLIYIYDSADDPEHRVVKIIVHLDYKQNWRDDRSKKKTDIILTSVKSGSLVEERSLKGSQYEEVYPNPKRK